MVGFLNIYKPSGMTSFAVVNTIKKHFNIKKIGHMGTLDPMACGILPIAIGKATRLFDYSLKKDKVYRVIFEFGYTTDTLDKEGEIINTTNTLPTLEEIKSEISKMIGKCQQVPPNFSAKKVNGERAYDLARKGIDFELKPKEIEIYDFTLLNKIDDKSYEFLIKCSSGTYIRSIGRDLATRLNTLGCMVFLERVESGVFNLNTSITLDKLITKDISECLISPLQVFENFDTIKLNSKEYKDLLDGKGIKGEVKKDSFLIFNDKVIGIAKENKDYIKLSTYLEE